MSRLRGTFVDKNNYEVTAKRPYDARMLVPTYADLTDKNNWLAVDPNTNELTTSVIAFNGLIVAVADKDDAEHSGIYMLYDVSGKKTPDVESESNWLKIGSNADAGDYADQFAAIQKQLDELEDRLAAVESTAPTTYGYRKDFPEEGVVGKMYIAADVQRTYVYTAENGYVLVGAGFEEADDGSLLINGGTAD